MYLKEYKNGLNNKKEIIIKISGEELEILNFALLTYNDTKEKRIEWHGESTEKEFCKKVAKLEKQFGVISEFSICGIDEILENNKE
jgi:hypothetical protein